MLLMQEVIFFTMRDRQGLPKGLRSILLLLLNINCQIKCAMYCINLGVKYSKTNSLYFFNKIHIVYVVFHFPTS